MTNEMIIEDLLHIEPFAEKAEDILMTMGAYASSQQLREAVQPIRDLVKCKRFCDDWPAEIVADSPLHTIVEAMNDLSLANADLHFDSSNMNDEQRTNLISRLYNASSDIYFKIRYAIEYLQSDERDL